MGWLVASEAGVLHARAPGPSPRPQPPPPWRSTQRGCLHSSWSLFPPLSRRRVLPAPLRVWCPGWCVLRSDLLASITARHLTFLQTLLRGGRGEASELGWVFFFPVGKTTMLQVGSCR